MFLVALVKEKPVKRHYVSTDKKTNVNKKKTFFREYTLEGVSVCRDIFVKTLQTFTKRINTSLHKMRSTNEIIDKRGNQAGYNRSSPESVQFVIDLIKKLPTYISHYGREKCKGDKYLRPKMDII